MFTLMSQKTIKPKQSKADKQLAKQLDPFKWKPGQSGNPNGRPKGPTLKEWVRQRLLEMDDAERIEFIRGVPREIIWKMSEGNPKDEAVIKSHITISDVLDDLENDRQTPSGQSMEDEQLVQSAEQAGTVGNVQDEPGAGTLPPTQVVS